MPARMRKMRQLSTSLGRQQFWRGARNYLWQQLRVLAGLHRRTLALQGRLVRCGIDFCNLRLTRCDTCPKLATGWSLR